MSETPSERPSERLITTNRRARHEYDIEETVEAGLVLTGTEVKALRTGRATLGEAYARVDRKEAWLHHLHIPPYGAGNIFNHDPLRRRKLLLHRSQILRLASRASQKGYTLIPLRLYFSRGKAKVEIGLARGKKLYDKRSAISEREAKRTAERAVKRTVEAGRGKP